MEREPAMGTGGINLVVDTPERGTLFLNLVDQRNEVFLRTRQAIELSNNDHIAFTKRFQQRI